MVQRDVCLGVLHCLSEFKPGGMCWITTLRDQRCMFLQKVDTIKGRSNICSANVPHPSSGGNTRKVRRQLSLDAHSGFGESCQKGLLVVMWTCPFRLGPTLSSHKLTHLNTSSEILVPLKLMWFSPSTWSQDFAPWLLFTNIMNWAGSLSVKWSLSHY